MRTGELDDGVGAMLVACLAVAAGTPAMTQSIAAVHLSRLDPSADEWPVRSGEYGNVSTSHIEDGAGITGRVLNSNVTGDRCDRLYRRRRVRQRHQDGLRVVNSGIRIDDTGAVACPCRPSISPVVALDDL